MLKETATSITPAVMILVNISIALVNLPDEWKTLRVKPIQKAGNYSDPRNCWPISLLSVLRELLEKHIRNLLVKHLDSEHPLSTEQWGLAVENWQQEPCWLLLTTGSGYLSRVTTSVSCFWIALKFLIHAVPLTQMLQNYTTSTHIFWDGLHSVLACEHNISVLRAQHLTAYQFYLGFPRDQY